jgi:hypothetical protein
MLVLRKASFLMYKTYYILFQLTCFVIPFLISLQKRLNEGSRQRRKEQKPKEQLLE